MISWVAMVEYESKSFFQILFQLRGSVLPMLVPRIFACAAVGGAAAARREIRRYVVLLYALLRQYLRKERDLATLGASISDEERAALADVAVRPCLAAYWLTAALMKSRKAGRISDEQLRLMDA